MAQRKLSRSLYRSLFRWSRQACVRDAPLAMNPINYGVSSSLLEKVDFGREAVVTSAQDFRNLTRSSFRLEKSESEVNAALDSLLMNLPRLFTESEMISQRTAKRMSSSSPENLALRTFRVGEVVLHKESKTRHVVTGWEIDNGVQHIHTLCDHLDQQNSALSKIEGKSGEDAVQASSSMSSTPDNANSNGAVSHTEFEHVHNKVLMRILNESVNNFFDGYDTVLERYIPNAHLQYSFPADYSLSDIAEAAFKSKISTHLQLDTYEGGVDGYIAEVEEANRRSRTRDEKEIFYVVKSLRRLLHEVNGQLDEIMAFYEVDPNASLSEETAAKVMSAEEATTHILDSMLEMLSKLKGLERELGNLIVDPEVVSNPSKSLSGNRIIYESVSTLSSILIEAEKMLDFRWQSRGHIHFEQEMQQRLDFAIAKANGEVEGEEMPALEPTHSPPVFRIGEVVKTKRFGWRGVIISVHLRPDAPDAGNWEGVSDTPSGAAQPFYRVLPDESDMTEGTSILARLIAEENLELHDTSSQGMISTSNEDAFAVDILQRTWSIQNRWMSRYFTGFDIHQSRYIAKQKLQFVFPHVDINSSGVGGPNREEQDMESSRKEIPWLPSPSLVDADIGASEIDLARINDMESNLKNILATVNAKQVSRVRTEREAANRKAYEGMTYGPTLEEIQAAAQPGHNVAETVLMEVFRTVRQVFAQCRVRSTKIALNRTAAEDDATHQPVVCPYDPTRLTEEGLDVEDDNIPSLGDDGVPLLHMSHLSYLLRNARKREDALSVEAVMWGVWVTHSDWRVSTEMMQGNNLLELGKTADAITFYQNAADLDPTYAEPYNKIAAASLRLEQYRQCEEYAEKGLERCPQHYAAMAGFGTALEKRGILGTACKYLEQTLVLHPFAGRVPTFLATVLNRVEADRLKAMETVLAGIEKSDSNVIHNVTVLDPSDDADVLAKVEEISRNVSEVNDPSAGRHGASAPLQDSKTRYTRTWETTSTPEPVDEKNR